MGGRKTGDAYQIYGFTHSVVAGKHRAICCNCKKELQNTAASRMKIHRNNCKTYGITQDPRADRGGAHEDILSRTRQERLKRKSEIETNRSVFKLEAEMCHLNKIKANSNENESNANSFLEPIKNGEDYLSENPMEEHESNAGDAEALNEDVAYSKSLQRLQEEKLKAEIKYFKQRTEYYSKELENVTLHRTLLQLQAKKLRLEIGQFEDSS